MKKINRWLIFLLCVPTVAFAQQNSLLQKYRSMALDYNHDLKVFKLKPRLSSLSLCI